MTANPIILSAVFLAGSWIVSHYRRRAAESGVQTVARQLRKQGYPLEVAVAILARRSV